MATQRGAEAYLPEGGTLSELTDAARTCRGCDLYRDATGTVFGAGPADAGLVVVGEVPGDREDVTGQPFVGPAGGLLDDALTDVGIDRENTYLTNAVKHFRFETRERGKRRIHKKPARSQIVACRPWLVAEVRAVHPRVVVCLGAVAAQSVFGVDFRLSAQRGEATALPDEFAPESGSSGPAHTVGAVDTASTTSTTRKGGPERATRAVATIHPSAVLRAPRSERDRVYSDFVSDLRVVADELAR